MTTDSSMHCNHQNESCCSVLRTIRPNRGKVRFFSTTIFLLAAAHFAVDYMVSNKNGSSRNNAEKVARATSTRDGLWNVYSTDQTTPEQRSMILADHGTQIKQKFSIVSSKSTAHLLDPSILIPDYPDQTDVCVVEHDIVLSNSSSRHGEKGSPVALCYPTAQVQITFSKPHWTLTTLDKHGNKKHIGGDEFYIVYRDSSLKETSEDPTAIALIQDYENGTYTLDFITIPTKPPNPLPPNPLGFKSLGNLTVYFDYTCGIGSMAPPSKRHWDNKGSTSAVFTRQHVPQPRIRTFQHPTKSVNMSSFDFVNFIGASTMRNLVDNADERWQSRVHLQQDFRSTLNTTTVDAFVRKINRPETLQQQYGNNNNSNPKNVALVLGSDVWDILSDDPNQGSGFEDHLLACARAVQLARQVYPNVTILWKSPTAMHIFRLPPDCHEYICGDRVRYMSASRSNFLYHAQKELMAQLYVPFLDIYQATYLSAFQTIPGDGRHYRRVVNRMLFRYLFS